MNSPLPARRLGYLFPGQGSQAVGMGQALAQASAAARDTMAEADEILGFALSRLCYEGPAAELTDTVNTQPALLAVSVAAFRAAAQTMGDLPRPVAFAGHSLGEYTAMVASGALSFADGLRLVRERGRLMKAMGERRPGRMAAVMGVDAERLSQLCQRVERESGEVVRVANDNGAAQQVISGTQAGVDELLRRTPEIGARRAVPLAISIAAHSPLMAEAGPELTQAIQAAEFHRPAAPVLGNTTVSWLTEPADLRRELEAQLEGGVRWHESMQALLAAGVDACVEFGSGAVLAGLMRRAARRLPCFSVENMDGITKLADWMQNEA